MQGSVAEFYENKYKDLLRKFSPDSPLHDLGDLFRISILSSLLVKRAKQGIIMVDLGCGPGFYIQRFPFCAQVAIGIDISATVLRFAKQKLKMTKKPYLLIRADIQRIPLRNGIADYVIIVETLEHVQSDKKVIQEVHRILREDQIVAISVPNSRPFPFSISWMREALGTSRLFDLRKGHLRNYSVLSLKKLLESEGLKCIRIVAYGHLLLEVMEVFNSISGKIFFRLQTIYHNLVFPFLLRLSKMDQKMSGIYRSHGFFLLANKPSSSSRT